MELKQQDEKLFKIYTSCLVSSEMPHTLDIEQVKLCLVPDEQLEEGKNSLNNSSSRKAEQVCNNP